MKKKVLVSVLVMILCCSFTLYSQATVSDLQNEKKEIENNKNETEEELNDIKVEKNEALSKISELSESIEQSEQELKKLRSQITELENSIKQLEKEIKEAEVRYNEQKLALEDRIIAQYKSGKTTYLDVLLNSTSLSNFISNYFLVGKIARIDKQLLEDINTEKETIERKKANLDEQKVDMKAKKAEAEKKDTMLKNAKAQKVNQVSKLSETEQELQKKIEEYDRQEREVENKIQEEIKAAQSANSGTSQGGNYTGGKLLWPVPSSRKVTSPFGERIHPIYHVPKMHKGIDVGGAKKGDPFIAVADGKVIRAKDRGDGYGKCVMIDHGNGLSTLYAHGSEFFVKEGEYVKAGTKVLAVGDSGLSTGVHAHFEVRVNSVPVDPMNYL